VNAGSPVALCGAGSTCPAPTAGDRRPRPGPAAVILRNRTAPHPVWLSMSDLRESRLPMVDIGRPARGSGAAAPFWGGPVRHGASSGSLVLSSGCCTPRSWWVTARWRGPWPGRGHVWVAARPVYTQTYGDPPERASAHTRNPLEGINPPTDQQRSPSTGRPGTLTSRREHRPFADCMIVPDCMITGEGVVRGGGGAGGLRARRSCRSRRRRPPARAPAGTCSAATSGRRRCAPPPVAAPARSGGSTCSRTGP